MSRPLLKEKEAAQSFKLTEFKASTDWLEKFLQDTKYPLNKMVYGASAKNIDEKKLSCSQLLKE